MANGSKSPWKGLRRSKRLELIQRSLTRLVVYNRDLSLRSWPALSRRETSRLTAELDTNASGMASNSWAALGELFGNKASTGKKPLLTRWFWELCTFN